MEPVVEKQALRRHMLQRMKAVAETARIAASDALVPQVQDLLQRRLRERPVGRHRLLPGLTVLAFLSQPKEIDTWPIINSVFAAGGSVLVPHCVDLVKREMVFVQLLSEEDVAVNFPETGKLRLRELTAEAFAATRELKPSNDEGVEFSGDDRGSARVLVTAESAALTADLMLAPGVAFDELGGRCGRGAGFYDEFIRRMRAAAAAAGRPPPPVAAIGYAAQFRHPDSAASSQTATIASSESPTATHSDPDGCWWDELALAASSSAGMDAGAAGRLVPRVPMTAHDERVDYLIWPGAHRPTKRL